jgi:hypothetical protein
MSSIVLIGADNIDVIVTVFCPVISTAVACDAVGNDTKYGKKKIKLAKTYRQ